MRKLATAALPLVLLLPASAPFSAPTAPQLAGSTWYYEIGGARPIGIPPTPDTVRTKLSLNGELSSGYSCGNFDPVVSIENTLNDVARGAEAMTQQMVQAANAAIAALPAMILQRADPGLYDLFQGSLLRAEEMFNVSLKSCEQMEAQITEGINPYHDLVVLSRSNGWKRAMGVGGRRIEDINAARLAVEDAPELGLPWVGGRNAGGKATAPIRLIEDATVAGYNRILSRPPDDRSRYRPGPAGTMPAMVSVWERPDDMAEWANKVLGETEIRICDTCAPSVTPAAGLETAVHEEEQQVRSDLFDLIDGRSDPSTAELQAVSSPGVAINLDVLEALRALPPSTASIYAGRLAADAATGRSIEKALFLRRALLSAKSTPELAATGPLLDELDSHLARLEEDLDNIIYEREVRQAIAAPVTLSLLRQAAGRDSATLTNPARSPEQRPPSADDPNVLR